MLRDSLWIIIVTLLIINTFGAIITVFSQKGILPLFGRGYLSY